MTKRDEGEVLEIASEAVQRVNISFLKILFRHQRRSDVESIPDNCHNRQWCTFSNRQIPFSRENAKVAALSKVYPENNKNKLSHSL